jgi:flagellar hook protein FlgE
MTDGTEDLKEVDFSMMRSMFSGVSGLRVHQTKMDVIGNNIANVNTVGFKSGRVTFQEVFNQTLRGAGAPDLGLGRGGTNPMQVGLGLGLASIDTIMTRGNPQRTDNPTDLSIEGDGFFIVRKSNADTYQFTRAGNFNIDEYGFLNLNGMIVQGWLDYNVDTGEFYTERDLVPINIYEGGPIPNKRIIPPKVTEKATFSGNLNSDALSIDEFNATNDPAEPDLAITDMASAKAAMEKLNEVRPGSTCRIPFTVYDRLGNAHEIYLNFIKQSADATQSQWLVFPEGQTAFSTQTVTFDANGKLINNTLTGLTITPLATAGTGDFDIEIDFSGLTCFSANNSVNPSSVDGYTTGNFVNLSIGSDGVITGIYSNGQMQPLGLIALASFDNPAGLQKSGDNLYMTTPNSGDYAKQKPGDAAGSLNPGTLEMSNVDLSREFTEMIITQRGFQANSRIITTSDEMLQELVSLKR